MTPIQDSIPESLPPKLSIHNICDRLYLNAILKSQEIAITTESETPLTYEDLTQKTNQARMNLKKLGLKKGDRVLCLFPMGIDFIITLFSLFAEDITVVLIDPRLKKSRWKQIINEAKISAIISTPKILQLKWFFWWLNQYQHIKIADLKKNLNSSHTISNFNTPLKVEDYNVSLLTLTSGTTGKPKLIPRNFKTLKFQQTFSCSNLPAIKNDFHLSLYGLATMTDLIRGEKTFLIKNQKPQNIYVQIIKHSITRLSLPPGTLSQVCQFLESNQLTINGIQSLLTGGAPIPRWLILQASRLFPKAQITIVYGSTECEPISFKIVDASFFNQLHFGYNIGKPIKELQVIKNYLPPWNSLSLFEIELKGLNCVPNNERSTLLTGDIAYENEHGDLVLVGRKVDLVDFPFLGYLEEHLERIEGLRRVACIPRNRDEIHIFIELEKVKNNSLNKNKIMNEINNIIFEEPYHLRLIPIQYHFINKIPVDPRHHWKIQRHELKNFLTH